jgi:hypothetical protein
MMDAIVMQSTACARQVDWRFLLPQPEGRAFEHLLLMGGSAAIEASILDLGVAQRVSRTLRHGDRADALIVLAGATESLDTAARHLDHNGVLYWEIDRRVPGQFGITPARALRQVKRQGLNPAAAYWVKPGFPVRQMYLPLQAGGAFRWYLDTLYRTPTRLRRIGGAALRALATARRGLAAFAPCYAITAVRGTTRPPALIERAGLAGVPIGEANQPVLLAYGDTEWNRLVLLLFHPNASGPTAAIKLARTPVFNQQVEWEHDILRELGSNLAPPIRRSVPTSALFRWNGLAVSAETCVTGSSLSSRAGPAASGALKDLRLAVAWLASFHRETTIDSVPARPWLTERLVNGMCADYAATFGLTADESRLFATLSRRLEMARPGLLPIVWQHADFGPPNVYLDRSHVSVIDWETARRGPALADLLYFVMEWSAAAAGRATDAERLAHFESLFCASPADLLTRAVHGEIAEYMRRVDLASSLFAFLLVYTFLEKALERTRRLAKLERADAAGRAGNRFVAYVGVLAQHAQRVFREEGN